MIDKEIGKIIKQIIANFIFSGKADEEQCGKWREILEKVDEKFGLEHDELF